MERFYKVYIEQEPYKVDKIIAEKEVTALLIEIDSISDKYFDYVFQICSKHKHLGIPIIVFSENAKEVRDLFEQMKSNVDKIISKPFVYENLVEEIYKVTEREYIRRKLIRSLKKINKDLLDLATTNYDNCSLTRVRIFSTNRNALTSCDI